MTSRHGGYGGQPKQELDCCGTVASCCRVMFQPCMDYVANSRTLAAYNSCKPKYNRKFYCFFDFRIEDEDEDLRVIVLVRGDVVR